MPTIFEQETSLESRGSDINIQPSRRPAEGVTSATNFSTALAGVSKILEDTVASQDPIARTAESLDRRVRAIEADDTLNSFQKSEKKSQILNAARAKVGKDGKALIDSVFDAARTKPEINPLTGEVQFVNAGTGEVTKIAGDTAAGVKAKAIQDASVMVDSYFPTMSEVTDKVLTKQIADNPATVLENNALPTAIGEYASIAAKLQNVHEKASLAIGLPADQQTKLIEFANREYANAATDLFNTFYSDTIVNSLHQKGGMTPEDAIEMLSAAERDFMAEVSSSGVPNDMAALKTQVRAMRKDLEEFFLTAGEKDLRSLNRQKEKLTYKNEITKQAFLSNNPDIIRIEALKDANEVALDLVTTTRELEAMKGRGTPEQNATVEKLINGQIALGSSVADSFQRALSFVSSSPDEITSIQSGLTNLTTDTQLLGTVSRLKRLINDPYSFSRNDELKALSKEELPKALDEAVKKGWMLPEAKDRMLRQMGVVTSENDAKIRSTGKTWDEWSKSVVSATTQLGQATGRFLFGNGQIEQSELTKEGTLKPVPKVTVDGVNPVQLTGTVDEE